MKMKKRSMLVLAFVLIFTLAACSGGSQETGSSSGGSSNDGKILIGLSMDTLQEERWQRDRDLFVAKAE